MSSAHHLDNGLSSDTAAARGGKLGGQGRLWVGQQVGALLGRQGGTALPGALHLRAAGACVGGRDRQGRGPLQVKVAEEGGGGVGVA